MKRKKAGRKTRKTPPEVKAKPLRPPYTISQIGRTLVHDSVNGGFRRAVPADFAGQRHNFRNLPPHAHQVLERTATGEYRPAKRFAPTTMVYGVPLPPDFEEAVEHYAGDVFHGVFGDLESEFDGTEKLDAIHRRLTALIRGGLKAAFRDGFYLALIHHSDDLKQSAKAAPLLEVLKENTECFLAQGREAKAENDRQRAALICKLYKAVRRDFPPGRKGNGPANCRVAERFEMQTGQSVTVRTVRDTVKEAGLSDPPRRKGKH